MRVEVQCTHVPVRSQHVHAAARHDQTAPTHAANTQHAWAECRKHDSACEIINKCVTANPGLVPCVSSNVHLRAWNEYQCVLLDTPVAGGSPTRPPKTIIPPRRTWTARVNTAGHRVGRGRMRSRPDVMRSFKEARRCCSMDFPTSRHR